MSWINEIPEEKIPEPYRTIYKEVGPEAMLKMAEHFQGMGVYFCKLDGLLQELRNQKIQAEFTGGNYKDLARKYKLTETWIRNIISQKYNPDQVTMFL